MPFQSTFRKRRPSRALLRGFAAKRKDLLTCNGLVIRKLQDLHAVHLWIGQMDPSRCHLSGVWYRDFNMFKQAPEDANTLCPWMTHHVWLTTQSLDPGSFNPSVEWFRLGLEIPSRPSRVYWPIENHEIPPSTRRESSTGHSSFERSVLKRPNLSRWT